MTQFKNILLVLLIMFFFESCRKDETTVTQKPLVAEPFNGDTAIFVGKWIWYESFHQFGACQNELWTETLTPQTENTSFSIEFFQNGNITFIHDNTILQTYMNYMPLFEEQENNYQYAIYLNNDIEYSVAGLISSDSLRMKSGNINFPFDTEAGCEIYLNYFVKQ